MIKISYIKKLDDSKYRVYSEKGRNMGTYSSLSAAKKRLRQIEYFKQENNLEQPIRINLDPSERIIKKLHKASRHIESLGFKKEAQDIKAMSRILSISFIVTISVSLLLNRERINFLEDKDEINNLIPTNEISDKDIVASEGQTVKEITKQNFPQLEENEVEVVSTEFAQQNGLNKEEPLKQGTVVKIVSPEDINKVSKKITETISKKHNSGQAKEDFYKQKDPRDLKFNDLSIISDSEGFQGFAYDGNNPNVKWKPGRRGTWVIGYGHLLTQQELRTGSIIINGETYKWQKGLSKQVARKLMEQDIVKNLPNVNFDKLKVTEEEAKIISSLCYLYGPSKVEVLIERSTSNGQLDGDKFRKNLSRFNVQESPGAYARRIAEILTLDGIKLPPPDKSINSSRETMSLFINNKYNGALQDPTKTAIDVLTMVVGKFDSSSDFTNKPREAGEKMRILLDKIESREIKTQKELIDAIRQVSMR